MFGSAYNCQGYIGAESLMGVISIVILIIILYCSVVFMFSINMLDRFDDLRDPTITVENLFIEFVERPRDIAVIISLSVY